MHEAQYYHSSDRGELVCDLCPHGCRLHSGQRGICRVRRAEGNRLIAEGYGLISSEHIDPIEKKPLSRFYPGTAIYSIGGWGCNFRCDFCQNWTISQQIQTGVFRSPQQVVEIANQSDTIGIAYTYNEPLISFEFIRDCAKLSSEAGLKNVIVTNGYINREPAEELLPFIDALNIDIKSMEQSFYTKHCGGKLDAVLSFARQAVESGVHVEITNLLIPGENDDDALIDGLAKWINENLGRKTPLHISAYFPRYKMNIKATQPDRVLHARELALRHLDYVYAGNI